MKETITNTKISTTWMDDKHNNNKSNEDDNLSWEEEYERSEHMEFLQSNEE